MCHKYTFLLLILSGPIHPATWQENFRVLPRIWDPGKPVPSKIGISVMPRWAYAWFCVLDGLEHKQLRILISRISVGNSVQCASQSRIPFKMPASSFYWESKWHLYSLVLDWSLHLSIMVLKLYLFIYLTSDWTSHESFLSLPDS